MVKKKANSALAQPRITKEMQRLIAVAALDKVYSTNKTSLVKMREKMAELFHGTGDENNVSLVELCLDGKMQFEHLWDRNEAMSDGTDEAGALVLKQSISRDFQTQYISKVAFTEESLRASTSLIVKNISGRTLLNMANNALSNLKKANAYALQFLTVELKLPSGKTEVDLDICILEMMFTELKGRRSSDPDEQECDDESAQSGELNVSTGWMFNGWFAFKCFGPMGPAAYRLVLTELGDQPGGKRNGRAFARSEASKERSMKFNANVVTDNPQSVAMIAQAEDLALQRHKEKNTILLTTLVQSTSKEIDQCLELIKLEEVGSANWLKVKADIHSLRNKLEHYRDMLHEEAILKRKTPDAVLSFLTGAVGSANNAPVPTEVSHKKSKDDTSENDISTLEASTNHYLINEHDKLNTASKSME
jgi:hypothetical protein